jgi:hypothetical protein
MKRGENSQKVRGLKSLRRQLTQILFMNASLNVVGKRFEKKKFFVIEMVFADFKGFNFPK